MVTIYPHLKQSTRSLEGACLLGLFLLGGCASNFRGPLATQQAITAEGALQLDQEALGGAIGAKINFNYTNFYTNAAPRPDTGCAGDVKTYYDPFKMSNGKPMPFPVSVLDPLQTVKPLFIKNVSIDISDANATGSASFNCSYGNSNPSLPPPSLCSTFDLTGFLSGYYTFQDRVCDRAGPISINDPSINKLLAGGVYIDLDRDQLGLAENLLLSVTHMPLGYSNHYSDGQEVGLSGAASFKVHLIKAGVSASEIHLAYQPRHLAYSDTDRYPQVVQSLAVVAPPLGQIRQDQMIVPIAIDPSIDRIRIERYSGSGIILEVNLVRMGEPYTVVTSY